MLASMRRTLKRTFLIDVIFLKPAAESDREMSRSHSERYRPQLISRLINATHTHARAYDRIVGRCNILFIDDALIAPLRTRTNERTYLAPFASHAHVYFLISLDSITTPEKHYDLIALSHFRTFLPRPLQQTWLIRSFLFPSRLFCLT